MIIKKSADLLKGNPYPLGYQATSTAYFNADDARLHIRADAASVTDDPFETPVTLELRFALRPIPFVEPPLVQLVSQDDDRSFQGALYQKGESRFINACHKSIELVYTGCGRRTTKESMALLRLDGLSCIKDESAYRLDFCVQSGGEIRLKRQIVEGQVVTSPPGCVKGYPVWAYGGYYRPDCALHQIEQIFFSFSVVQEKMDVNLLSAGYFTQKGIAFTKAVNYQGIQFAFMDFSTAQPLSLKEEILKGAVSIFIDLGKDETGEDVKVLYESYAVGESQMGYVDILFKKKEI